MTIQPLTLKEQATNFDTFRHIERLRNLLNVFVIALLRRGEIHDQSKLEPPEVSLFTAVSGQLSGLTYGSPEYTEALKNLGPALEHHYANNRHHPEYFEHGIEDMNLVDLMELLADWKASSERHADGSIRKSIKYNSKRFNISPQLQRVLENTIELLERR